jgi:flavin-dependent dehydrogenase
VLDALLVDAAREAGAEVRQATTLTGLDRDGVRVVGVRLRDKRTGAIHRERAPILIGADGRHSKLARLVEARTYRRRPASSLACYTYWDGLTIDGGEMHSGNGWAVGAWPTHDELTMTYIARRAGEWDDFHRDPLAHLLATLDCAGTLGDRARHARRVAPVRATNDLGGAFREASRPGWALAGDAGLVMDPITGLGMGNALRDAELVATALTSRNPGRALRNYGKTRDKQTRPAYELTAGLARLQDSTPIQARLFAAIAADAGQSAGFLAVLAGVASPSAFFSPANLIKLIGWRGLVKLAKARPR